MRITASLSLAASAHGLCISDLSDITLTPPELRKRYGSIQGTDQATIDGFQNNVLNVCGSIASQAADAALNEDGANLLYYFGMNDDTTRQNIARKYINVMKACLSGGIDPTTIWYSETAYLAARPYNTPACIPPTLTTGYADAATGSDVILCPAFFTLPVLPTSCWSWSQVNVIIHEFFHCDSVLGTGYGLLPEEWFGKEIYGKAIVNQDPEIRINTPDAYAFYALATSLGCVQGAVPPNPPVYPPNPSNTEAADVFTWESSCVNTPGTICP